MTVEFNELSRLESLKATIDAAEFREELALRGIKSVGELTRRLNVLREKLSDTPAPQKTDEERFGLLAIPDEKLNAE